jgi:hypothetical protein
MNGETHSLGTSAKQPVRDDALLYFRSAFEYLRQTRIAPVPFHGM